MQIAVGSSSDQFCRLFNEDEIRPPLILPREFQFPSGERLDGMMIGGDAVPVLVECKLSSSPAWKGSLFRQIDSYVDQLITLPWSAIRLRADLRSWRERYGERKGDYEKAVFGDDLDVEEYWQRVEDHLKSGKINVAIIYDEVPKDMQEMGDKLGSLTQLNNCLLIRARKSQKCDYASPEYHFGRQDSSIHIPLIQRWTPWPVRRVATEILVKQQKRVKLVNPPSHLWVDDTYVWSRNYKPDEQHAIDPARTASFVPVMPNLSMLETIGSPYPQTDKHVTVEPFPNESWRPWLAFARAVWRRYDQQGMFSSLADGPPAVAEALQLSPYLRSDKRSRVFGERAVVGTMRDLSLFGLGRLFRHPIHGWELRRAGDGV